MTESGVCLPAGIASGPRRGGHPAQRDARPQPRSAGAASDLLERLGTKFELLFLRATAQVPAGVRQELPKQPAARAVPNGHPPAAPSPADAAPATTTPGDSNQHGGATTTTTTDEGVDKPGESFADCHAHSNHPEQSGGADSGAPPTGLRPGGSRGQNHVL